MTQQQHYSSAQSVVIKNGLLKYKIPFFHSMEESILKGAERLAS